MLYPDARYYHHDRKICDDNGNVLYVLNYYDYPNGNGGFVRCTVEINQISHTVDLAIMDYKNQSIPSADISPRDVMEPAKMFHQSYRNAWAGLDCLDW